jgi:hypothetical protein
LDVSATQVQSIGAVIDMAVAPVFLLSGVGIVLTVLTNRLARVVDRARRLEESARQATYRARLMNRAITLSTIAALLVASVVVLLFVGAFVRFDPSPLIAGLFITAMLSLIGALICFLREVFLSIKALKIGD